MAQPSKFTLGPLEEAVMHVIWRRGAATVREVVDDLPKRQSAYTTIMTVMNRLTAQRILRRQAGMNGAFCYQPVLTRTEFSSAASRQAIDDLVQRYGTVAMAQFVDKLDRLPPDRLAALRRQLRKQP